MACSLVWRPRLRNISQTTMVTARGPSVNLLPLPETHGLFTVSNSPLGIPVRSTFSGLLFPLLIFESP